MTFINLAVGLDVWAVSASLFRYRDELKTTPVGMMAVYANGRMDPKLEKWGSMRTFLAKCRRMSEGSQWELLSSRIEQLQPGDPIDWWKSPDERLVVEVCLVTNPGAILLHGNQVMHLPVGHAVAYGTKVWNSAINCGDRGRIHLVLELEKRAEEG